MKHRAQEPHLTRHSVAGFIGAVTDTPWFVESQVPQKLPLLVTENSLALAWQLGNIYLLLGFISVALFTSVTEVKVIKRYLVALALGDVGHIGWCAYALGMDRMMKPLELNLMAYANIAPTVSWVTLFSILLDTDHRESCFF